MRDCDCLCDWWGADSILGVSLFANEAPDDFGVFIRAFITMFRVASGKRE